MTTTLVRTLVSRQGRQRIAAYRDECRRYHVSDYRMRRILSSKNKGKPFDRIRFRVGSVVRTSYVDGSWLVIGHSYTGADSNERGCIACQITDRIFIRWRWIGPENRCELFTTEETE